MFKEGRSSLPQFFINEKIECKNSPIHGVGVFARQDIPKRTMIESCAVLPFHVDTLTELYEMNEERHILQDYVFKWKPGFFCIAWGWVSLYNHDDNNNAQWRTNHDLNSIEITTTKDIKAGEEIFIKYMPSRMKALLWFSQDGDDTRAEDMVQAYEALNKKGDPWKMY